MKMNSIAKGLIFFFLCSTTYAHGTLETPISRLYNCFKENPENPKSAACKEAVNVGGKQALYDWNGLNQAAANDQHEKIILDGRLCSANKDLFKGMDLARNDWPTTTIAPDGNGRFDFTWNATAPHETKYFRFYITKPNYDFTQPLKWSDLEAPFCTITNVTLEHGRYKMNCPVPKGEGKRIIYVIWQRKDSFEAFYACADVVLANKAQSTWTLLDNFYANTELKPNTKAILRIFKDGTDIGSFVALITADQTAIDQWPYYLAKEVNDKSSLIHMGKLNQKGEVVPVKRATENKIYINEQDISHYHYAVDYILPNDQIDYIYPDNISSYKAGTIVMGFDKKRYQCKPWPASGWCSMSPVYYEPGKGLAWEQAWTLLG